jgi:hypothetical protein
MSNRIDQLFKDSLSEHKVAPSAEAWTKVKSRLSKKNKLVIVWRIAAVFVLFGAIISTWYFLNNNEAIPTTQLTEKIEIDLPQQVVIDKEKAVDPAMKSTNSTIARATTTETENRKKRTLKSEIKREAQNTINHPLSLTNNELQKQVEETAVVTEPVLIAETVKPEKPIVIEFTLESISTKSTIEVAKTVEENSGLKKILETARDVKNGDSDLSIIRDAKNQLLALDFRKDKIKRN